MDRLYLYDFIKGIFDDPYCSSLLQFWNEFPDNLLRNNRLHREPIGLEEIGNRWGGDAGEDLNHTLEVICRNVHLEPHHSFCSEGPLKKKRDLFNLFPFPWILIRFPIGNQLGIGLQELFELRGWWGSR